MEVRYQLRYSPGHQIVVPVNRRQHTGCERHFAQPSRPADDPSATRRPERSRAALASDATERAPYRGLLDKEGELAQQLVSSVDKAPRCFNRLTSIIFGGGIRWQPRIFKLVAPPPKVCKWPEPIAELGPDHCLYCQVASIDGSAQALLG